MNKPVKLVFGLSAGAASFLAGCSDSHDKSPELGEPVFITATSTDVTLPEVCETPYSLASFEGDPNATQDQRTWNFGVVATVMNLPENAIGIVAGFEYDGAMHDSQPLPTTSNIIGYKLGPGELTAGAKLIIENPQSIKDCLLAPLIDYQPLKIEAFPAEAVLPTWE